MAELSHGQGLVLVFLHNLALAGTFVVDAAKVEDAMDDDAMKLVVVGLVKLLRIAAHRVERDDDVAIDDIALVVVEGDDVGVVVVTEILTVYLQYLLIADKHVSNRTHTTAVAGATLRIQAVVSRCLILGIGTPSD